MTVHGTPVHVKCYLYHDGTNVIVSVGPVDMQQCRSQIQNEMHKLSKVKNGCKYAAYNKQFRPLFPDTFTFFRQVVTL